MSSGPRFDLPELLDSEAVLLLPAVGSDVAPAIGPAAVRIRDVVGVGKLTRADDRASPAVGVAGAGERGNASGDISRRLGDREAGLSRQASRQLASETPKFFSIRSERSQPGVTPTTAPGSFSSSAASPLTIRSTLALTRS